MAYVNEKISKEDFEKYNLEKINKRLSYGTPNYQWAIDRDRDIWLREYHFSGDKEDFGAEIRTYWDFYWKGSFVPIETKTIDKIPPSKNNGIYYCYIKVLKIEIPKNIQQYTKEILKDFREALEVSQVGIGIHINDNSTCKVDLEYNGEVS
ncbi:MAG: hypothetical protein LBC08_05180 [Campylobacteraceae bacterium]|jgi:hypothetical protein|nr:hypothetical protein [Campylobacteraceae bacterium]